MKHLGWVSVALLSYCSAYTLSDSDTTLFTTRDVKAEPGLITLSRRGPPSQPKHNSESPGKSPASRRLTGTTDPSSPKSQAGSTGNVQRGPVADSPNRALNRIVRNSDGARPQPQRPVSPLPNQPMAPNLARSQTGTDPAYPKRRHVGPPSRFGRPISAQLQSHLETVPNVKTIPNDFGSGRLAYHIAMGGRGVPPPRPLPTTREQGFRQFGSGQIALAVAMGGSANPMDLAANKPRPPQSNQENKPQPPGSGPLARNQPTADRGANAGAPNVRPAAIRSPVQPTSGSEPSESSYSGSSFDYTSDASAKISTGTSKRQRLQKRELS